MRPVAPAELMDVPCSLPPPGAIGHSIMTEAFDAAGLGMPRSTVITYSLQFRCAPMTTGRYLGLISGALRRAVAFQYKASQTCRER